METHPGGRKRDLGWQVAGHERTKRAYTPPMSVATLRTVDQFLELPQVREDDYRRYELWQGELVEMGEAESCCGFGGMFAVKFPQISTAMAEVK